MKGCLLPSSTRRITHVLMFGLTFDQWLFEKSGLKSGLQGAHMGWTLTSGFVNTVDDAVCYIRSRPDLELVQIFNWNRRTPDQMRYAAQRIAHELVLHETHPWVHFYSDEDYLRPIFDQHYITVGQGFADNAVFERWLHRVQQLERTEAA